jgi:predicted metalloendopeptidase
MGVIGYNSPIGISVAPSPADPDANAVWLSQAGLGMPHRGYYLSFGIEDESLRLAYRSHVINVLRLIGSRTRRGRAADLQPRTEDCACAYGRGSVDQRGRSACERCRWLS